MGEYICPYCKQPTFDDEALLCHFCGESLGRASAGALGHVKGDHSRKWLLALVILLVVASFIMLMWR